MGERPHKAVLGEMTGHLLAYVSVGDTLVIYAWPLGNEGRKHYG